MTAKFSNPFWKAERDALEVLTRNDIGTAEATIIRTGSDAILFSQDKKAYTAWLEADGRKILRLDKGFPADYD